ncbi:MAG: DUF3619 family protein [Burkholderiaceae bacterium]
MKKEVFSAYAADRDALQNRFALRVAARLNETALGLGPDVSERLRFARERALQSGREARQPIAAPSTSMLGAGGAAVLGGGPGSGTGWWVKLGSALPLIVLVAGLILIQRGHVSAQIATAAEVDAALLADDLPPTAYGDAGFVEFLKAPRN